ncbi:SusC/RagA family TonB-linked outer membrane protein [Fulvitalea axinellae]|uniref:SusC/RagA family TonB-linked outer membrane protein n=1 Tax=Fulvitalea axinellae TaxID=1182444 RepID=A0AAU9CHX2_9BACT|nr:SusC/RagA family TonB-linked outer membrane protein [Fulvitalea axinellae]
MKINLLRQIWFMSRLTMYGLLLQTVLFNCLLAKDSKAQLKSISEITVSLKTDDLRLGEVFDEIERETGFSFIYSKEVVNDRQRLTGNISKMSLEDALQLICQQTGVGFKRINNNIYVNQDKAWLEKFRKDQKAMQTGEVTVIGTVISSDENAGLPGVSVVVKGTNKGVITDLDGKYTIKVNKEDILRFTYIGFKAQEVQVGNLTKIDIVLEADYAQLGEVVVVGYGTQKKASLTGAVSAISQDKITKRPVASTGKALQGLAPGLIVVDRGGMAGSEDFNMQIRGNTSLSGSSKPLVYIDGVEQSMNDINPNDIASISILKDAASTAMYGSRGANGVILITTKRAEEAGLSLSYNAYYSVQTVAKLPEKVGIRDYMTLYNEAFENDGQPKPFTDEDIENTVNGVDPIRWPNTDWHDVIFRDAPQQSHSLSAMGGSEKVKFNLGLNFLDQEGVLVSNNKLKRYGVRLNTDYQLTDKLSARIDLNMRRKEWSEPRNAGTVFWRLFHDMPPWGLPKLPDGRYGTSIPGNNQLARLESGRKDQVEDYRLFNAHLEYKILDGLTIVGEYMNRTTDLSDKRFQKAVKLYNWNGTFAKDLISNNGTFHQQKQWRSVQLRGLLRYEKTWGKHSLNALAGVERISDDYQWLSASRSNAYNDELTVIAAGDSETDGNGGNENSLRIGSYLGRINYSFADKYLLEANFRYDGSSRFAQGDTRWGFFPSFSAGWRVSEESFMKDISWLEEFKLRGSYGATGKQDNINYWQYISDVAISNSYAFGRDDKAALGAWQSRLGNESITWERTDILDLGLDLELFEGKLGIVFDYYVKNTKDVLNDRVPIPETVGFNRPAVNAGEIENRGWELSITHRNTVSDDFSYSATFNISDNTNEVKDLRGTGPYVSGWTIAQVGRPLWALWGYQTNGFYKNQDDVKNSPLLDTNTIPGDVKYVDRNKDGKINGDDKMYLGDASPHFPVALNLNLKYKNFDLNMFWQGLLQQKAYMEGALTEGPNYGNFTHKDMLGRWTPETAETATWPVLRKNSWKSQVPSDFWIRKAGYMRLKNIQIGYSLPKDLVEKLHLQRVRFYVSGDNLLTFSQEELIDPEFRPGRVNYHPQTKQYLVGLNVNF